MKMYLATQHVDYITGSVASFRPLDDIFGQSEPCRPLIGNYNEAIRYSCGLILQWHNENVDLKKHFTITGGTLDVIRQAGITDIDILNWILGMERQKIGRIDIAVTSQKVDGSVHGFLPAFAHFATLAGWCETRLKLDKPVTDVSLNIETAYVGQRKKREYLRVYDKGIELGSTADRIIRIELERHSVAPSIAASVVGGHDYGSIINRYVSFPNSPAWNEIIGTKKAARSRNDVKKERSHKAENDKLWDWIFNSVSPAFARAVFNDEKLGKSQSNQNRFVDLVTEHYNNLVDNHNKG